MIRTICILLIFSLTLLTLSLASKEGGAALIEIPQETSTRDQIKGTSAFESTSKRRRISPETQSELDTLITKLFCVSSEESHAAAADDYELIVSQLDQLEELAHHMDIGEKLSQSLMYTCTSAARPENRNDKRWEAIVELKGSILKFLLVEYANRPGGIESIVYQIVGASLGNNPDAISNRLKVTAVRSVMNENDDRTERQKALASALYALGSLAGDHVAVSVLFSHWDQERIEKVSQAGNITLLEPLGTPSISPIDFILSSCMSIASNDTSSNGNIGNSKWNERVQARVQRLLLIILTSDGVAKLKNVVGEYLLASQWWSNFLSCSTFESETWKELFLNVVEVFKSSSPSHSRVEGETRGAAVDSRLLLFTLKLMRRSLAEDETKCPHSFENVLMRSVQCNLDQDLTEMISRVDRLLMSLN